MMASFFYSDDPVITTEFLTTVAKFEGFRSKPYKCPSGVLTIGYGHTGDVKPSDRITVKKACEILYQDLLYCLYLINKSYNIDNWTIGLKQAITDFVFNCGIGTLKKSSLHKILVAYSDVDCNASLRGLYYEQIKDKLSLFVYSNRKKLDGLVNRRNYEISLL